VRDPGPKDSAILDLRMQILDLKAQYLPAENVDASICNLQSELINHTKTGPKDQVFHVEKVFDLNGS
jgi:hypothetical protein